MNEQVSNFLEVCKGIWSSLGIAQKVSIALIGLMCGTGLGAVVYYGSQPDYQPMFTGVSPENMTKITEILIEENVTYRLKDGGTTIEVPSANMSHVKMKIKGNKDIALSADGVNPFGYIYTMPLGMASNEKRIAWLDAVQKNLAQQINKMPKVIDSRVTLNLPNKRAFEKRKDSTAAVMLTVRHGDYISNDQVSSIRHLVSSSVENLSAGKVTIVDSMGRLLAKFQDDSMQDATLENSRREMKAMVEADLKRKVEDILIPAVGGNPRFVVAMVDVQFEHMSTKTTKESFDKGVTVQEKIIEENTAGIGTTSAGVTGTRGNLLEKIKVLNPEETAVTTEGTSGLTRKTSDKIMSIPKSISIMQKSGAEIKHISVSVNINEPDEKKFDPAKIEEFTRLVEHAVGAVKDPLIGRMDKVEVFQNKFTIQAPTAVAVPGGIDKMVDQVDHYMSTALVKNIMGGALLLALLLFYKKIFSSERIEGQDLNANEVEGELVESEDDRASRLADEAELALLEVELSKEMEAIKGASRKEPQTIATVIESWVMKESSSAES
jgi:flagellar M-ring protein FliF